MACNQIVTIFHVTGVAKIKGTTRQRQVWQQNNILIKHVESVQLILANLDYVSSTPDVYG